MSHVSLVSNAAISCSIASSHLGSSLACAYVEGSWTERTLESEA